MDRAETTINVTSEYGRLNAVLLHRPGMEIEKMTPYNAADALFSDILSQHVAAKEYAAFCGVLERWTKVYYVEDVLTNLMDNDDVRQLLVKRSCEADDCPHLIDELMRLESRELAQALIGGVPYHDDTDPRYFEQERYTLKPLYNLFFTRDASSSVYDEVLINSMSHRVRERETLLYKTIFEDYFRAKTFSARPQHPHAHTEGGDVLVAAPDLLCVGQGSRTNYRGVMYLADRYAQRREKFRLLVQELPHKPDSFIHLDMVFTFLGSHQCMVYQPMLDHSGVFSDKRTTLIECEGGKIHTHDCNNLLEGLKRCGMEMVPVFCGGPDSWYQQREQWHSGANFFALGDGKVIGYERNQKTIESLDKAGFAVLDADEVCSGQVDMNTYDRFVVAFKASELPRAGGGARCMTMPLSRMDN